MNSLNIFKLVFRWYFPGNPLGFNLSEISIISLSSRIGYCPVVFAIQKKACPFNTCVIKSCETVTPFFQWNLKHFSHHKSPKKSYSPFNLKQPSYAKIIELYQTLQQKPRPLKNSPYAWRSSEPMNKITIAFTIYQGCDLCYNREQKLSFFRNTCEWIRSKPYTFFKRKNFVKCIVFLKSQLRSFNQVWDLTAVATNGSDRVAWVLNRRYIIFQGRRFVCEGVELKSPFHWVDLLFKRNRNLICFMFGNISVSGFVNGQR